MKHKLVRQGVFETNSSSAHSISLGLAENKEMILDTIYPDENGAITLGYEEFGWDWFKHNDARTKAIYAYMQAGENDSLKQTVIDVITEQTGCRSVVFPERDDEFYKQGYIDHQSLGIVEWEKEKLRDFIFNKNSWLFGGNDNDCAAPAFYDVPVFGTKDGQVFENKVKLTHRLKFNLEMNNGPERDHRFPEELDDLIEKPKPLYEFAGDPTKEKAIEAAESYLRDYYLLNGTLHYRGNIWRHIDDAATICYRAEHIYDPTTHKGTIIFTREDAEWDQRLNPANQLEVPFEIVEI